MDYKEAEMVLDGFYNSPYTSDIANAGRAVRDALKCRIAELEQENERLLAELKTVSTVDADDVCRKYGCVHLKEKHRRNPAVYGVHQPCRGCEVAIGKPSNWKAFNKYDDIRKLSEKDCKEIFDYAMQRSKEILEGNDE